MRRLFSMSVQSDEKATNITMKKGEFYDERLSSWLLTARHGQPTFKALTSTKME